MGEIISFQSKRRAPRAQVGASHGGAEILFFTGVRYAAYVEPPARPDKKPAASRRRKTTRKQA